MMPDTYADVVCFACLDRINPHSSVEKRSKGEFGAHEHPMSLDLTQTFVFLNVHFHGVILEHCDIGASDSDCAKPTVLRAPLFVCLCTCVFEL